MINQLQSPGVPIIYPLLTIQQAEERGVRREHLLEGVAITPDLLAQPDAKIPLVVYGHLIARALRLTGDLPRPHRT